MLYCSGCRFARYCCRRCQVADWRDHKDTCIAIKNSRYSHRERRSLGIYYGYMQDTTYIRWQLKLRNMDSAMRLIGDVPILRVIGGLQLRRARGEMPVAYDDEDGEQFQLVIQRRRR